MRYTTTIILLLCELLSYSQQIPPHKAVKIILESNKEEYYPFEPIEIKVELKNISNVNQHFVHSDIGGRLKYALKSKKEEFHFFLAFQEMGNGEGGIEIINKETEILPNQSKKGIVYPNKFYDLGSYYGDLELTVGYPIKGEINGEPGYIVGRKNQKTKIKIIKEPKSEEVPVKLFSEAISKVLGTDAFNKKISENLEKLITEYPNSYLTDQAYYFLSVYYYQLYDRYQKPEQLALAKKYLSEFFQRFPQSVYRKEAEGLEKMIRGL